jgi:hypothetical protein
MFSTADSASVRNSAVPPQPEGTAPNGIAENPGAEDATGLAQMDDVDAEGLAPEKPPRRALTADTLTKLLDSARGEVRGYRSLYYTLFGFGLLALSPITAIYRSTSCTADTDGLLQSIGIWGAGIASLLFGSIAMLPRTRYPDSSVNEFAAIAGTDLAIHAEDDVDAQDGLIRAIQATHEIQVRVVERGRFVFLGALLIIISVGLAFVRWAIACQ